MSKPKSVTETLTTANGNELTVLGETQVRLRIGSLNCVWTVMIARTLAHDCILGSDFQYYGCQINYETGIFAVAYTELFSLFSCKQ